MSACLKSKRLPRDKHIVIVGGGFGGIRLAEELMKYTDANFTLISLRAVFHQNVAGCRAAIEPGLASKTMIPLAPAYGCHFRVGRVVAVKPDKKVVVLQENDEEIAYDVLVLCTGTGGPFPFKVSLDQTTEEALDMYSKSVEKIQGCEKLVVIGGGATGVEMAAELATIHPLKSVTMVTSAPDIVPDISVQKFKDKVKDILKSKGVKMIFGERVTNMQEIEDNGGRGPVKTNQGTSLEADCVFNCMGLKVNSAAYSNGLGEVMDAHGRLQVNDHLQVIGYTDIFALGDCCDTNEVKIGYIAGLQAAWLASQLTTYFAGGVMKPYPIGGAPVQIVLALGKDAGLGLTKGGWIIPSFGCVMVKSKDLFLGKAWKQLKQKMPT